jgi:PAS domain S-box-containing protein
MSPKGRGRTGRSKERQGGAARARDEWERTFEAVPDLIAILDGQHRIVRINKAMAQRLGIRAEEAVGRLCYECVHGADGPPALCPHVRLLADGGEHTVEIRDERLGGDFLVSVTPLRDDAGGKVVGAVHVARDITELKRVEEELRRARDGLEVRVQERTYELEDANIALQDEATERRRAEEAARQTNELLETMFSGIDLQVACMDRDFNFIRVNRAYARADGHEPEFYVGRNHFALFPNEENLAIFRRVVETGEPFFTYEKPFEYASHPERGVTYWDWSLQPVHDARGRVGGVVLSLMDVTERKRAQRQVADERQRLFSVLNMLPAFISGIREDYSIVFVNEQFRKTFGEPVGRPCYEVLRGRDSLCDECQVAEVFRTGRPAEWQWTDGRDRTFRMWGYPFSDADGSRLVLKLGLDITDRKELERQVLEISGEERHRIGRDLHDVLGQNLTGIAFLSKALAQRLKAQSAPAAWQAAEIADLVTKAVAQTRALSRGLCPVELVEEGLMNALRELASNAERLFGVPCQFECAERILVPDGVVATNLFLIAQEAVHNAVKHAAASRLWIRFARADGQLVLGVGDDGVGLPEVPVQGKGMGLRLMHYRANLIGASLTVRRGSGGGTEVICTCEQPPMAEAEG